MTSPFEWACIGHNPTLWAYGVVEGSEMRDIQCSVERQDDGRWLVLVTDVGFTACFEPSRHEAMKKAEALLFETAHLSRRPEFAPL